ncbi:MAG: hypothetical protein LIO94_08535 [Clostridiales bacterium]|nr:hypothetical protein [Clostridiales bacterium]
MTDVRAGCSGMVQRPSYSEEEMAEYTRYFHTAVMETKKKLKEAECPRAARRLDKEMSFYSEPKAMAALGVDWIGVLNGYLAAYCHEAILNQIIYTPRKYRKEWTPELIDEKIRICGLGEESRGELYATAGFHFPGKSKKVMVLPVQEDDETEGPEETVTVQVCRMVASG